ncbi:hypothetical protein [Paraburkholderia silvatlantica]|uniref:5-methylcytosine-specific restriction endonuclease McrA n=1 Tax=Paraburkholderia silvatlantica TaxID=321895 RepID=A0ABR6FPJ0_9BURK|nr:hypothetical protein [Paraburkholderia silvatlantica]MBB2928529.1 5-methylcytosine-specific restriction endonuclease McrA [Paraburkholderia silvatlantica]PVY23590.1 hypothetical protein C7411_12876 [Paraburkholderia silvatlantica]PXW30828.1 hypothetical protein C7413_12776 [Paraburkholderia silvatlantica]
MAIIKTILSLFKKHEPKHAALNDDDPDDLTAEQHDELVNIGELYEQTKHDAREYQPELIPIRKEYSRQSTYQISFHFIPPQQNYKNVRSWIEFNHANDSRPWQRWQDLRVECFKACNHVCQSCKQIFTDKTLELHELWSFDEQDAEQKLVSLIPLCSDCHAIAHISRHKRDTGKTSELLEKYCTYNDVSEDQAWDDYKFAEQERERRSRVKYKLNLSLLRKYGFEIDDLFDCHGVTFNQYIDEFFKKSKDAHE